MRTAKSQHKCTSQKTINEYKRALDYAEATIAMQRELIRSLLKQREKELFEYTLN